MKTMKKLGLVALVGLPLIAAGIGCSSSNNGGTTTSGGSCGGLGSTGSQPTTDLAVGDNINDIVALYFDVLANSDTNGNSNVTPPTADIVLNNAGSGISDPNVILMVSNNTGNDLYVGNFGGGGSISIFRDYLTLTNGAAADAVLDATAGIVVPADMLVTDNDLLVVANGSALTSCCAGFTTAAADQVLVFATASTIAADVAPDLTLDNGTSLLNDPISVAVAANSGSSRNDLYVANHANTGGNPLVAIFRDIDALTTAGVTVAPSAALNEDTSFLNNSSKALKVLVSDNILFVSIDDTGGADAGTQVYVFNGADSLGNDALPDAVLFGNDSFIDWPSSLVAISSQTDLGTGNVGTGTLIVGDLNYDIGVCTDAPALAVFNDTATLKTGQEADAAAYQATSNTGFVTNMGLAGNALFVSGSRENCDLIPTDVIIFRNVVTSSLCSTSAPNLIIPGTQSDGGGIGSGGFGSFAEVAQPKGMAVVQRDLGT